MTSTATSSGLIDWDAEPAGWLGRLQRHIDRRVFGRIALITAWLDLILILSILHLWYFYH